jgi:hypothetical protein
LTGGPPFNRDIHLEPRFKLLVDVGLGPHLVQTRVEEVQMDGSIRSHAHELGSPIPSSVVLGFADVKTSWVTEVAGASDQLVTGKGQREF